MPDTRAKEFIVHYPHGKQVIKLGSMLQPVQVDNRNVAALILELLESGQWAIVNCENAPEHYVTVGDSRPRTHPEYVHTPGAIHNDHEYSAAARARAESILRMTGAKPPTPNTNLDCRGESEFGRVIREAGKAVYKRHARERGTAFFIGIAVGLCTMALLIGSVLALLYLFVWNR